MVPALAALGAGGAGGASSLLPLASALKGGGGQKEKPPIEFPTQATGIQADVDKIAAGQLGQQHAPSMSLSDMFKRSKPPEVPTVGALKSGPGPQPMQPGMAMM